MTVQRAIHWSAIAAGALLSLAPSAATAQSGMSDVIMAGRANGIELPASTIQWLESQGPDAFEFAREGVWKGRVAEISARRAAFDASARQRPSRGQTSVVTTDELQAARAVLDGTFRMPILLGLPSDRTAPHSVAAYQDRMFGANTNPYSLTTLYDEMSGGLFNFTGDVIGWGALPNNAQFYYGTGNEGDQIFGNTPAYLTSTVAAVDDGVNFGLYDNDGPDGVPNSGDDDGFVDLAAFMFPAHGRECGGPGIWAHRYRMSGWGIANYETNDVSANAGFGGVRVRDYIIQGGLDCDGSSLQQIGVVAHEAGHGFGLPDLYDTQGASQGIGEWGLMGSGNWNEPESPAHMAAHSKMLLGWIDVVTIGADTTLTIEPIMQSRTAYRVNIPNASREYFLLENRQKLGSEAFLNGTGLLIWHVDSITYENGRSSNTVNGNVAHKGLDLEEADGQNHLDAGSNRGDAGDTWPGSSSRFTFDATSSPNSGTYGSGPSNVAMTDIQQNASNIIVSVNVPDAVTFGDVTEDGLVTVDDLDVVKAYVVGVTGPDYSTIAVADVDEDGDVDAMDAFIIHAYLEGKDTSEFVVGDLGVL